jgi:acetyltransferase-like isoleucine patch superfamily enzyme
MFLIHKFFQTSYKLSDRIPDYLRGMLLYVKIRLCGGQCGSVPRVASGFILRYPPHAGVTFGRGVRIGPNCIIECPPGALLKIGDRVGLTASVLISSHREITIGHDCLFAENVSIRDAEHTISANATIASQPLRQGAIRIESDVWIGKGSIVLQDSVLRHGSVVGANSFLKSHVTDSFGIYVGAPAKKIRSRAA